MVLGSQAGGDGATAAGAAAAGAEAAVAEAAVFRCHILGECRHPGLAGGQHHCECGLLVHNLCLQHLLGTGERTSILCGGVSCKNGMTDVEKAQQLVNGVQARKKQREELERAEERRRQQQCGAGNGCIATTDSICAKASCCGSPRHFRCTGQPCQPPCSEQVGEHAVTDLSGTPSRGDEEEDEEEEEEEEDEEEEDGLGQDSDANGGRGGAAKLLAMGAAGSVTTQGAVSTPGQNGSSVGKGRGHTRASPVNGTDVRGASSGVDACDGRSPPAAATKAKRSGSKKTPVSAASTNTRRTRLAKEAEAQAELQTSVMQFSAVKTMIRDSFKDPAFMKSLVEAITPSATETAAKKAMATAISKESTAWTESAKTKGAAVLQTIVTDLLDKRVKTACQSLETSAGEISKALQAEPAKAARGSKKLTAAEKAAAKISPPTTAEMRAAAKTGASEGSASAKEDIAKVHTDVTKVIEDVRDLGKVLVAAMGDMFQNFEKAQELRLSKHADDQDAKLQELKKHVTDGFRTTCDYVVQQVGSHVKSDIRSALDEDNAETRKRGPQRSNRPGETPPSARRRTPPSRRSPRNHDGSYRNDNQESSGSGAGFTSRDNEVVQAAVAAVVAQTRMAQTQSQPPATQQTPISNPFANGMTGAAGFMPGNGMNPGGVGGGVNYAASQGMGGSGGVLPQGFAGPNVNNPFNVPMYGRGPYGN